MKTLAEVLNEAGSKFTITILNMESDLDMQRDHGVPKGGDEIETFSFDTKKEANQFKRKLMKERKFVKMGNNIANMASRLELHFNY